MSEKGNKECMAEIEAILTKYDLMGMVIVSDGEGQSEHRLVQPSWSCLDITESQIRIKNTHLGSDVKYLYTDKTVNASVHLFDLTRRYLSIVSTVMELIEAHFDISTVDSASKH